MASENLGRNLTFKIHNADGTSFHNLEMKKATYDSVVMSLSDKITGDVYYKDNALSVAMSEYIEYQGTKFVLVNPPTIVREGLAKDNSELKGMTKYSFEFYHPMYKLANMPFTDVAVSDDEKRYKSQDKTFAWVGTGYDFIAKINKNLENTPWVVVPSSDEESISKLSSLPSEILPSKAWEEKQNDVLSFDNSTIADALKTAYDAWGVPFVVDNLSEGEYYDAHNVDYYSVDGGSKRFVIVLGLPSNEIIDKESEHGTVVSADQIAVGNIYYDRTPITVPPGVKIVVESLEEENFPVILNETHSGVIGTTNRTFSKYTTVYVGLSRGAGNVRYTLDNSQNNVYVFKFGQCVGLKNNSRTPRNNKIVTRIAGYGSEDNIPYGYPQIVWTGDKDAKTTPDGYPIYTGIVAGHSELLIKHPFTRTHLMPSIYSETVNKKVNPYAEGYNPNIEIVDYYDADSSYPNPIVADSPSYEIHEFGGVKPELGVARITDAKPLDKDNITVVDEWDDSLDENGNYVQSYFRITLPPLGFDIYASAAITQEMKINMRSGACIGCTFNVQVDWEDYKANFYNSDGEFAPSGEQRDYEKYPDSTNSSIYVTVQKEIETFGTLMPNIYQYPKSGDEFVILGISMPLTYIANAEQRLDDVMRSYMLGNNIYYYDYPLKFDEYFLSQRTDILEQLKPNSIVRFLFGNDTEPLMLYVKQLTIKYGNGALPQYDITLTDNIEVVLNRIGQVVEDVEKLGTVVTELRRGSGISGIGGSSDKLSRQYDDEAHGLIGFLKGLWVGTKEKFGWDAQGNINANNIVADGDLVANKNANVVENLNVGGVIYGNNGVRTNEVRSQNYTGDTVADAGFLLTNSYNGHSKLTIDEIYVRMKAVFESLEVKKWSVSAGDEIRSCASNTISKVDYFDGESAEPLGYSDVRVPWLLRGVPFILSKFSTSVGRKMYSTLLKVRRTLTDEQLKSVKICRCYFLAKNGETEIENWWDKDDLARCQTMNIVNTARETYTSIQQKNGNVFWWRKVVGVSSSPVEVDGHSYHYIDIAFSYEDEKNDTASIYALYGSDIPAAGDHVCQFGNTVKPGRMNLMMIQVNGGGGFDYDPNNDAPCIKAYKGIYCFDLNKCWFGGSPMKMKLSPTTGYQFYGPEFKVVKEYGTVPVPTNRGTWTKITLEKDDYGRSVSYSDDDVTKKSATDVRKCYYYDEVSHLGCVWLCSIVDGAHWIVETAFDSYKAGQYISDSAYNALSAAQKVLCARKPDYTSDEPSDNSTDWTLLVEKGDKGAFMSRVFCRSNDRPDAPSNEQTEGYNTFENPIPPRIAGQPTWTDGAPQGDAILWSSTAWFYSDGTHSNWTAPSPETDTQTQDIEFSPSYYEPAAPYGDDASQKDSADYKTRRHNQKWYDPSDTLPSGTTWSDMIWRAERQIKNGVYSGQWSISRIKGESSNRLDLTNQADLVSLDADGKVRFDRTVVTIARIFEGGTIATANVEKGSTLTAANMKYGSTSTCTVSDIVNGQVTITWNFKKGDTITADSRLIVMKLRNVEYSAAFSLGTTDSEYIYQLNPSPSEISFSRTSTNTLTPSYVDLYCGYTKSNGSGTTTISNPTASKIDDNNYLYYRIKDSSGSWGSWTAYSGYIRVYSSTTNIDYELAISTASSWRNVSDSNAYEREVIPVVKDGKNGDNSVRVDLDNNNDTMLYSSSKGLVSGQVSSLAHLYDGAEDKSSSTTWKISASSGVTLKNSGNAVSSTSSSYYTGTNDAWITSGGMVYVNGISAASASITVQGTYTDAKNNAHVKYDVLTIKKIIDGDKYELIITPNAIAYNSSTDTPAASTLAIQVWKTACDGTRALSAPATGYYVYANGSRLNASSTGTYSYQTDNSAISEVIVKIAQSASSTDCLDSETIPVNKAENGKSALVADLSNQQDSVAMTYDGKTTAATLYTTFRMFYGTQIQTLTNLTYSGNASGISVSCNASTGLVTVTVAANKTLTSDKNVITLTGTCDKGTLSADFTIQGVRAGANGEHATTYKLVPSASEIVVDPNNSNTRTPSTITCSCTSIKNGTTTTNPSEATIQYSLNGSNWYTYSSGISAYDVTSKLYFRVVVDGEVFDIETIPLIYDGKNGLSGDDGMYYVTQYALSDSRTNHPAESSSSWSASQPDPTDYYPYVWQRARLYDPNISNWASGSSWIYVCLTGEQGPEGDEGHAYVLTTSPTQLLYNPATTNFVGASGFTVSRINNGSATTIGILTVYPIKSDGTRDTAISPSSGGVYSASSSYIRYDAVWTINSVVVATASVLIVKYGETGGVGHVGRFYYYAGEYSSSTDYTIEETQAPYVKRNCMINGVTKDYFFMLDNNENAGVTGTWRGKDPASYHDGNPWSLMSSEQQYYIAKAFFGDYAQFGSFIINGDWLISTQGVVNVRKSLDVPFQVTEIASFVAKTSGTHRLNISLTKSASMDVIVRICSSSSTTLASTTISGTSTSGTVSYNLTAGTTYKIRIDKSTSGQTATADITMSTPTDYLFFNGSYPQGEGTCTFCPNYAVDGLTGKTYQNDAVIRGEVHATSGEFTGKVTASNGKIGNWEITSSGLKTTTGNPTIDIYPDGSHFLKIENDQTGGFLKIRNDAGKAATFSAYGTSSEALNLVAQGGENTWALTSYGRVDFNVRSGEVFRITDYNNSDTARVVVGPLASFKRNIITGYGSKSLPSNPTIGMFVFVKGTTDNITVSGGDWPIMASDSRGTSYSVNIEADAHIFVFSGTFWLDFNCG